jgi:hypothetical protein
MNCEICNAMVTELRRGRCWGCYARWVDARPVGHAARCLTCGDRRRRVLKSVELYGAWQPLCFNCAGQVMALDPMPPTIAALKEAVSRERRAKDRRKGKPDTRVFQYERRVGERRTLRADGYDRIEDEMIIEVSISVDDSVEIDFEDMTMIRELLPVDQPAQ